MFFKRTSQLLQNLHLVLAFFVSIQKPPRSLLLLCQTCHTCILEIFQFFIFLNMPITSSLLVFLLCVSLHACNVRLLGAIGKEHEKKFAVPNKNDEKVSLVKPDLTKELGATNIGDTMEKQIRVENQKATISKAKKLVKAQGEGVKISSQNGQSLLWVPWRVPRKKLPGEQQPGLNSDYSPPKVHPPVHN